MEPEKCNWKNGIIQSQVLLEQPLKSTLPYYFEWSDRWDNINISSLKNIFLLWTVQLFIIRVFFDTADVLHIYIV
jgi:hypothetical protein